MVDVVGFFEKLGTKYLDLLGMVALMIVITVLIGFATASGLPFRFKVVLLIVTTVLDLGIACALPHDVGKTIRAPLLAILDAIFGGFL